VEQFGEGIFLQFSPEALAQWLSTPGALGRAGQLQSGATAWINAKRARGILVSENSFQERERPEYVMAHSLAHALMTEVAIDCGYPASALKERLYAFPRMPGQPIQCGSWSTPRVQAIKGHWVVSWRSRGVSCEFSDQRWNGSAFVLAIPYALITIPPPLMKIERCMGLRAMAAYWSQKPAAKPETCFWIAR
jgi:hypothetical protein